MSYQGEKLNECKPGFFDFKRAALVVVSGSSWNPCGHILLKVYRNDQYGFGDTYFHYSGNKDAPGVTLGGSKDYPRHMDNTGFSRYLQENGKKVLETEVLSVPNPKEANRKLCELMAQRWDYHLFFHNCQVFIEEILKSGGNSWNRLNCPSAAVEGTET